jgi:hypothetical protein
LPWPERIELDLWYIEHESLVARPARPVADRAHGPHGPRPLPGRDRRLARRAAARLSALTNAHGSHKKSESVQTLAASHLYRYSDGTSESINHGGPPQ